MTNEKLFPLQLILREILIVAEINKDGGGGPGELESIIEQVKTASLLKYAMIMVSSLPLLIIYPFLQRYFVKGVLIRSVKE